MKNRNFLLLLISVVLPLSLFAQAPLPHKPKIYISPEGRMYINKSLPVYLRITTSPNDNAPSYLLHSEQTPKYTNPMYFDTEGTNTVRSPSAVDTITHEVAVPKQDIIFEVYADSKSPRTHLKFQNSKKSSFVKDGKTYVNGDLTITLNSRDEMSGVEQTLYALNGASFEKYESPLLLKEEREYNIKYYAVDNVGNMEPMQSKTFVIDKSAPQLKHSVQGDLYKNIISGHSRFIIYAKDTVSGLAEIFYRLDSGAYKSYSYPINASLLSQGEHTIRFYAVDNLDNRNEEQVFDFYVDKTPPVIVQEFIGRSFITNGREYASGKTLVKLTTFDNKAGVKAVYYSVNGGSYQLYEKPFYPIDKQGELVVKAYALDNVNNKSVEEGQKKAEATISFIDLTGPKLKYSFSGPVLRMDDTLFISRNTDIRLRGYDDESGFNRIDYKIDNGDYNSYASPFKIESEGKHIVHFIGYDNVDNSSQESFLTVVDNTGPEIYNRFSISPRGSEQVNGKTIDRYPSFAILFLSSTDNRVGVDKLLYSVNGDKEQPYKSTLCGFKSPGKYFLKIKSIDKLGNTTLKDLDFIISNIQ